MTDSFGYFDDTMLNSFQYEQPAQEFSNDSSPMSDKVQEQALLKIMDSLQQIIRRQDKIDERLSRLESIQSSMRNSADSSISSVPQDNKWTEKEQQKFIKCLETMSKSQASQISQVIGTKTPRLVTTHCQKFYEKLQRRC